MTVAQINAALAVLENSLAANPTGEAKESLLAGKRIYQKMLRDLAKKNDQVVTPDQPKNLPNPADQKSESVKDIGAKPENGERLDSYASEERNVREQTERQEQTAAAFSGTIAAPKQAPRRKEQVKLTNGDVVELELSGAISESRRYFMGVFNSALFKNNGDLMTLKMYCNLIAYYTAWVTLKDGKHPTVIEIMKAHSHYSEENQKAGSRLLEQLRFDWENQ